MPLKFHKLTWDHAVQRAAVVAIVCAVGCPASTPSVDLLHDDGSPPETQRLEDSGESGTKAESATYGAAISSASSKPSVGLVKLAGGGTDRQKSSRITSHPSLAATVFRPSDIRPRHNDRYLAQIGIFKYESVRLKLYSDIDPKNAKTLPLLMDQAYDAWVEYFGPLPPNRERTEYQLTGYIIANKTLFKRAGLLPHDLPQFLHGRHRGAEFWMNDQAHDYYRRHLMIHEGTHCFMTTMSSMGAPIWYMEGIAELFGGHWFDKTGKAHFRVMPHNVPDFAGFGRIIIIQQEVKARGYRTLQQVTSLRLKDSLRIESYAWSWALCKFLDTHPRYRDRFRELGRCTTDSKFKAAFRKLFNPELPRIWTEWPVFATNLVHGYDFERSAIDFREGMRLGDRGVANRIEIVADRSWQSSGIRVEKGCAYEVTASGQFTVAQKPIPWISKPNGITFRYYQGRPLGLLVAAVRTNSPSGDPGRESMLHVIVIGNKKRFIAQTMGTLYFRVNDFPSELANNSGKVLIVVRKSPS